MGAYKIHGTEHKSSDGMRKNPRGRGEMPEDTCLIDEMDEIDRQFPKSGRLTKKQKKKRYKLIMKWCKRIEKEIKMESLAQDRERAS